MERVSKSLFLGCLVAGFGAASLAEDNTTIVPYAQLPPAVQKVLQAEQAKGAIETIERNEEEGEVTFTVTVLKNGHNRDYTLNQAGKVIRIEVTLAETPPAVQTTIRAQIGSGTLVHIDKQVEDKEPGYAVDWKTKDGADFSFTVSPSGKLESAEMALADAPAAVRTSIEAQAAGGTVGGVTRKEEDEGTRYTAEITKGGQEHDYTFDEAGTLVSVEVELTDTPAPVQSTIHSQVGPGTVGSVVKNIEKDGVTYDVDWKAKNGVEHALTVAESGKLESVRMPLEETPPAVQKGIQTQATAGVAGTVGEITRKEEDEGTRYTAEITKAGQEHDYVFDEAGTLVSVGVELKDAPAPVQTTIRAQIGSGTVGNIDKKIDKDGVSYDVDWKTKEGAARSLTVAESGKLESVQITLEETPPAVRAAIAQEAGSGQVKEVSKSFDDNAVSYDVTVSRDETERDFTIAESGKLTSRQVFLPEVPAPAQATIQRMVGKGRVVRINQEFEKKGKVFPFEVESLIDGKPYNFSVGPAGKFLGVD